MKTAIMYTLAVVGIQAWIMGILTTHEVLMAVAMLLPVAAYHILMKA